MNKKGLVSRTVIMFSIIIYILSVTFMYGLIGQSLLEFGNPDAVKFQLEADSTTQQAYECADSPAPGIPGQPLISCVLQSNSTEQNKDPYTVDVNTYQTKSGIIGWFKGINVTLNSLPWWLNLLIWTPLIMLLGWLILVSLIPTINPGA